MELDECHLITGIDFYVQVWYNQVTKGKGIDNMFIRKKETIMFSETEEKALMMVINMMNSLVKSAECPTLRKLAEATSINLNEIICEYGEEGK